MKCAMFPSDLGTNLALVIAAHILVLFGTVLAGGKASGSLFSLVRSLKGPEHHVGKSVLHVITTLLSLNIMLTQFPRRRKPGI